MGRTVGLHAAENRRPNLVPAAAVLNTEFEDRCGARPFYIGLMSGTSLDGVDGVLASFGDAGGTAAVVVRAPDAHPALDPRA